MSFQRIFKIGFWFFILVSLVSCGGTQPGTSNTWALVKLISQNEPIDSVVSETIDVRNCVVPEVKTTECSAGTSNNLSVDLGGGVEFGEGISGSISGSISSSLGMGQQSGQSLSLDTPLSGSVYIYGIEKHYSVVTGQVLARSQNGNEQIANYNFHATCSITIVSKEEVNCSSSEVSPSVNSYDNPTGHIVFSSNRSGDSEIYIMNADGTDQKQLTFLQPTNISSRISPNGEKVVVGAYYDDGTLNIYIVNADGTNLVELVTAPNGNEFPFWDPDSTHIYYSTNNNSRTQLYKIDINTWETIDVMGYDIQLGSLSISPNGKRIAFQQILDSDQHTDIFSIDIDGNNLLRLTYNDSFSYHTAWSPNGQQIAFASGDIWIMNIDGSNLVSLPTGDFPAWSPSWSPDGNWIAFNGGNTHDAEEVFIIRADGTDLIQLTNSIGADNGPSWGP